MSLSAPHAQASSELLSQSQMISAVSSAPLYADLVFSTRLFTRRPATSIFCFAFHARSDTRRRLLAILVEICFFHATQRYPFFIFHNAIVLFQCKYADVALAAS